MSLPWSDIPVFLALAREGRLSSAAQTLAIDRTTVSRRIENMERELSAPLFERNEGGFILTAFGRQVFAAAEGAEQELATLDNTVRNGTHKNGSLRVSLSEHLLLTLAKCFHEFALKHPDILLRLTATDHAVDLQHFEADVVLRIAKGSPNKLESRNIGRPIYSLYCKKDTQPPLTRYLARPNEKTVPKHLGNALSGAKIIVSVDGLVSMREMIAQGTGVGILPNYFGDLDPRLERCSGPMPSLGFNLHIAFLPEQRRLHRLKIFVDFVENHLRGMEGFQKA